MSSIDRILVIIPNWNGADWIGDCLRSLSKINKPENTIVDTVVVDNGSTDNSLKLIDRYYSEVKVLKLDSNQGFTGGVNVGLNYAISESYQFAAVLNNDAIVDTNWIVELYQTFFDSEDIAAVAPKTLMTRKSSGKYLIDSAGDHYSIWGVAFPRGRGQEDNSQFDQKIEVFAASGCASMFRVSALLEVGLLDQKFFAYYEDVDLSFRLRLAGYKVLYQPKAVVYHYLSKTSGQGMNSFKQYHAIKNMLYVYNKDMPGWLWAKYLPRFGLLNLIWLVGATRRGLFIPTIRAYLVASFNLPYIISKRSIYQSKRIVNSQDIEVLLDREYYRPFASIIGKLKGKRS